jgi:AhpD family alkylhydroperoxidase
MTINGFQLHDTTTAPATSADILNGVQTAWGFVPNLHRVLAESPAALEAHATLWGLAEKTSFTPQERDIVYLSIIYENECTYCMAGHTNLSRMAKVDYAAINAVRAARRLPTPSFKRCAPSQRLSHAIAVSSARRRVAAFKAAGYANRAVLDILVLAATKLISNYTNHLAATPNDPFMKGAEWAPPGHLQQSA